MDACGGQVFRGGEVGKAKGLGAGRVADAVDRQRPGARRQVEHRVAGEVGAVGAAERARIDQLAVGPGQRPVEARGIAQRIEQQPRRRVEGEAVRSEEHTSELQSLMRISYAVFCLKKKKT